ncbi:RNA polymerase sigma factor [Kineococcus rubinsiae]|uniref:RNA polymerase sigma factor n=1 Tax=Kineococcus rubinsiae TaxID=2609562 RepID=UPI00142F7405|nr:RNA polymerase sigma factor [Kineococcus rubinsiae]NIZ90320.1 RNA polymerase sigma factor [Kineococcus rubinsiae]
MRALQPEREARFRALYADAHADVLRFTRRRVHPTQAEDVVADAFLVAWRRLDDAPSRHDDARAWLFGITRHCLLNTHRGQQRQQALAVRLIDAAALASTENFSAADAQADLIAQRLDLAAAWRRLSIVQQEVLALTSLDDLTSPQAAQVLGISATAYRLRLVRARRALRAHLTPTDTPSTQLETQP